MKAQANKHQKDVSYKAEDLIWLSGQNIKITQPSCDLKDKQLGPLRVSQRVRTSYCLGLQATMRVHNQTPPPA